MFAHVNLLSLKIFSITSQFRTLYILTHLKIVFHEHDVRFYEFLSLVKEIIKRVCQKRKMLNRLTALMTHSFLVTYIQGYLFKIKNNNFQVQQKV